MKKKNVINLIKYYADKNDNAFRNEAYEIAKDFDRDGDYQLAEYIMALLSNANTFVPQISDDGSSFLEKIEISNESLPLPSPIEQDIIGIINAVSHNIGINKFLFEGAPGTGKTETVKHIARILNKDLYSVNFNNLIDSKLGQTQKNITSLFKEINTFGFPEKLLILFDELDALALDRTNNNDIREMGRVTSSLLKELDKLNSRVSIIATTNLYNYLDKALIRRFDAVVNFDRYTIEDLVEIADLIFINYCEKFKLIGKNMKLFNKIIKLMDPVLSPGELKNAIKTSIAFSNINDEFDYMKRLFCTLCAKVEISVSELQKLGFSVREIEILTGISKSQVARNLKEDYDE